MNTKTNTTKEQKVNVTYETSKFALGVGISMAAIIGIWSMASLFSALASNGPIGLIKSFFTAVTGM